MAISAEVRGQQMALVFVEFTTMVSFYQLKNVVQYVVVKEFFTAMHNV